MEYREILEKRLANAKKKVDDIQEHMNAVERYDLTEKEAVGFAYNDVQKDGVYRIVYDESQRYAGQNHEYRKGDKFMGVGYGKVVRWEFIRPLDNA